MKKPSLLCLFFTICCGISNVAAQQVPTLSGRVLDLAGNPIADATITITRFCAAPPMRPADPTTVTTATSAADGRFQLTYLGRQDGLSCAASYLWGAKKSGFAFSHESVLAPLLPALVEIRGIQAPALTNVSAAHFKPKNLAGESMVASFGTGLATLTMAATVSPFPTSLAGRSIFVKDANGLELPAPLIFVSPSQINYVLPAGLSNGTALVTLKNNAAIVAAEFIEIVPTQPAIFCANGNGQGVPAAYITRVKPGNIQSIEPVALTDATGKYAPRPLDFGSADESLYLTLFGTGWRKLSLSQQPTYVYANILKISASRTIEVIYIGAQPSIIGFDQMNLRLPRELAGQGSVELFFGNDNGPNVIYGQKVLLLFQ